MHRLQEYLSHFFYLLQFSHTVRTLLYPIYTVSTHYSSKLLLSFLTISVGCIFLILFKKEFLLTLNPLFQQHKDLAQMYAVTALMFPGFFFFLSFFLGGWGGGRGQQGNRGDCCIGNFKFLLVSVERVGGTEGVKKEIQNCSFTYTGYSLYNVLKIRNNTPSMTQNL